MELSWLEDFVVLAEHQTFSRAADIRHVTQPAFSRRIRALEEWIGTPLFTRSPQGTSLTAAGKFLRVHAEGITRNLYQLRQETLEVAGREATTLSIAATHALSFTFFPGWIRAHTLFATPGTLNLISDSMEACEQIMLRGEANFLLCHYHRDAVTRLDPTQFVSAVVGHDVLDPLCAPDAAGVPRWTLPGSPHAPSRFLAYSAQSGLGRIIAANWSSERHVMSLERAFVAHLAAALLTMARDGEGIAWLPRTLAADDVAAGRLIDAGQGRFSIPVEIRLIRAIHRQSPTAEAFWKSIATAPEASFGPSEDAGQST